jgi:SAM-dependent methyltransferase
VPPTLDRCIVCAGTELDPPVDINDGWQMRVCRACKAGTTWPTPGDAEVAANNIERYPLEARLAIHSNRAAEFRARADQLLSYLPLEPESILDFGCNLGHFLARARQRGVVKVAGVEINETCRTWAVSTGLDVRRTLADFGEERFDVITFQDALEHVREPVALLRESAARLNPGGCLFIQLPNRDSTMAREAGTQWKWYSAPDHLMHVNPESLRSLAGLAGLDVRSLRTADAIVDVWLQRRKWIPAHLIMRLRRTPGLGRLRALRIRRGDEGGLIQAVLIPPS